MKKLIARMTIRKPGRIVTVEVRADAGFHNFYQWFAGHGRGRKPTHHTARSDGQRFYDRPAGLEVIAARFTKGETVKITIRNKKLYNKFLACSGDQLPGYKPVILPRQTDSRTPIRNDNVFAQPNNRIAVMVISNEKE